MAPAPLGYDLAARPRRLHRGTVRWLAALVLATLLGWAGLRWGSPAADRAAYLYRQHRLMRYTPPAGRVVFDSDPDRARALIAAGLGDRPGTRPMDGVGPNPGPPKFVAFNPPEANALMGRYYKWDTLLFVGGRRPTGGGAERLVCVCAVVHPEIVNHPDIKARQELDIFCYLPLRPITWSDRRLQEFEFPLDLGGDELLWDEPLRGWASLRIFAGRADPQDESRFSIEYEIEFTTRKGRRRSQRGFIDGRLGEDDHVHLELRPGPAADLWRQAGESIKPKQEAWFQQQE